MIRVKLSKEELDKLRRFRCEIGLTQYKVTQLTVTGSNIRSYESGKFNPSTELLEKLAKLYDKEEIKNFGVKVERKGGSTPSSVSAINKKESRKKMVEILNGPEIYDFSNFKKVETIQDKEENLYVPEKWMM
jgi:transcriptional regulator with XRE-family HTH domain